MKMDTEKANAIASKCGYLIIEDMPVGTTLGIDLNCWNIDLKFKGIKLIPPGLHFVFFSANDKHGSSSIRSGFFIWVDVGEVVTKKWDSQAEMIISNDVSNLAEKLTYKNSVQNLQALDQNLAPYPYENFRKWLSLTNHITQPLLGRLNPKYITACPEYTTQKFTSSRQTRHNKETDATSNDNASSSTNSRSAGPNTLHQAEEKLDDLIQLNADYLINYTAIPKRMLYPEKASASDISRHNIDTTYTLNSIISQFGPRVGSEIDTFLLGELQFSFICFMYGHHYDSFDQWKALVLLLCNSESAIKSSDYTHFYTDLISVLYYHLQDIPADFFYDLTQDPTQNFLLSTLGKFFDVIETTETQNNNNNSSSNLNDLDRKKLIVRAKNFKRYLRKTFGYRFKKASASRSDYYADDEAPVIVETPRETNAPL